MKIAINPGHYPGKDSGACGAYSQEAVVAQDVAEVVCKDLTAAGYETLFIQENELQDICDISNDFGADVFLSIHCNAADHEAQGTETFYHDGSDRGYELAKCVQHQLLTTMHSVNRGIKVDTSVYENGFCVLRETYAPAALAELDFIDNPEREDYLNYNTEEIGHALAQGVMDYVNQMEEE